MKRFRCVQAAAVIIAATTVAALTGCVPHAAAGTSNANGCQVSKAAGDSSAVTGKPSGTIVFQTTGLKGSFSSFFTPLIASFEKQNPGVHVKWIDDPGDNSFDSRMIAEARSCSLPDVLNLNTGTYTDLNNAGQLIDFSTKAPDVGKTFVPSVWSSITADKGAKHPVLPWYWGPDVMTFNASLYAKAGLDPKTPPQTFDQLVDDSITIAKTSGGKIRAFSGDLSLYLDYWQRMGVKLMNSSHTRFVFATDPNALDYVAGLTKAYKAGAIPSDDLSVTADPTQAYTQGTIVFGPSNPSFLRSVKQNAPKLYPVTEVAAAVGNPSGHTAYNGQFITVPVTTKHLTAAVAFATFLTNAQNQLAWAKDPSVVIFPTTTQSLKDPFFTQAADSDPMAKARVIAAKEVATAAMDPAVPYWTGTVDAAVVKQLQLAAAGSITPQQALDAAQTAANASLASK
jgi:ABC-type sugar transport system, periplasmic component